MEAKPNQTDLKTPTTAADNIAAFFDTCSPTDVKEKLWFVFKAIVTAKDRDRARLPDEEMALFFDQLTDLVSAAFELHQASRATHPPQKEDARP